MKWMLAAAAVAVVSAAPAHADDLTYLDDLKAAGFDMPHNGNSGMINAGHGICHDLQEGSSGEKIAQYLYENSHLDSLEDGRQLVRIARQDLCPGSGT